MASTIAGTTFGDDATFDTIGTYQEGRANIGAPIYDLQYYSSPGTNGQQVKNNGFRSRVVSVNLLFVAANLDAAQAALNALQTATNPDNFTATFDGLELQNCSGSKTQTNESGLTSIGGQTRGFLRVTFSTMQIAPNGS
jgi:hypothetical protein